MSTPRLRPALGMLAIVAAFLLIFIPSVASAGSGGIGTGSTAGKKSSGKHGKYKSTGRKGNRTPAKYHRLWDKVNRKNRRWARRVAKCESGKDPDMTAMGGQYRGAFMFTRNAWKTSPKSPGGDPIKYSYKTQAVVAVHLKKRDGTRPWPVCG